MAEDQWYHQFSVSQVMEYPGFGVAVAVVLGLLTVCVTVVLFCKRQTKSQAQYPETKQQENGTSSNSDAILKVGKSKGVKGRQPKKHSPVGHPLLAADFKGHTGAVLSLNFELGGKYLASCSEDRTIRVWIMKTLEDKDHKFVRVNVDYDHATHVVFSPDGTAVVAYILQENCICVYKLSKQKGKLLLSETLKFPLGTSSSIIALDIAASGKFIMTATESSFTVWTIKGEVLESIDTHQVPNTCAVVSPCGTFIACSGCTPDVKIWEVAFSKNGQYQQVSRAMALNGHTAAVVSVSFSQDSKRVASVSRDKTCKIWNIDVRYKLKEDPKLLLSISLTAGSLSSSLVALSPDALVVALSLNRTILIYSCVSGDLLEQLEGVHAEHIAALCWEPNGQFLASAGGEDRYIRLWHNRPGLIEQVKGMERKLSNATSEPLKQRLREQITKNKQRLDKLN